MLTRISFFGLFAIFLLATAMPARAEEPLRIKSMGVSVWPEYDQPGVLVQYQGDLEAKVDKLNPLELSVFVPKGAGVGAACAIQSNGNHTSETWKETEADDGLTKVTFKVDEPKFHVEYYYNPLPTSTDKKFSFAYTAAMPVDDMELDVQHPLKATNFVLNPSTPNTHKDQDGFTYHAYTFKQVAAGQKLSAEIAYTKTDAKPSVSGDKPASSSPAASTASDNGINPNQIIVIATVLALAGVLGFFIWQRSHRAAQDRYASAEYYDDAPRRGGVSSGGYCTQCGLAMEAGDRFCARCGNPAKEA